MAKNVRRHFELWLDQSLWGIHVSYAHAYAVADSHHYADDDSDGDSDAYVDANIYSHADDNADDDTNARNISDAYADDDSNAVIDEIRRNLQNMV